MADKTGRVPVVRTTTEEGMGGTWSTVPMAHSPTGFANLPYPWQQAKQDALKAHQAVKEGLAGDGKAAAETPTLPDLATRFGTESAHAVSSLARQAAADAGDPPYGRTRGHKRCRHAATVAGILSARKGPCAGRHGPAGP